MKINNREVQSDLIRVIAMLFVICVHVPTNLGERHCCSICNNKDTCYLEGKGQSNTVKIVK